MFVINNPTDQITSLIWGLLSTVPFKFTNTILSSYAPYIEVFSPFLNPFSTNEPLHFLLMALLSPIFKGYTYNIYLLVVLLTNLTVFYFVFKKYKFWWFGCAIFNLSAYYFLHVGLHPALIHLWVFPLFYKLYFDRETESSSSTIRFGITNLYIKRNTLGLILLLTIGCLLSNYFGFFMVISYLFLSISRCILARQNIKQTFRFLLLDLWPLIASGILIALCLSRFILLNYFGAQTAPEYFKLIRPENDFIIFTARPWYFIMPSVKNPLLSAPAAKLVEFFTHQSNYLFNSYFPSEHSALFLGFTFYILLAILIVVLIKHNLGEYSGRIKVLLLTSVILLLFMLPPTISINGTNLYLPSFLISKFFPMFRVLTRLIVVVHLFLSVSLMLFLEKYSVKKYIKLGVLICTILIVVETFIPVKILKLSPPEEFVYIRSNTPATAFVSIYPYSKTDEALLWLPVHERRLLTMPSSIKNDAEAIQYRNDLFIEDLTPSDSYILLYDDSVKFAPSSYKVVKVFNNVTLFYKP